MKKIIFITVSAVICILTISSCQKPQLLGSIAKAIGIIITDQNGNDLLTAANPNSIAEKIIVTYKGKTFKNMHPTDLGARMPRPGEVGACIWSEPNPNKLCINVYYSVTDGNRIPWEKGEEITITMPDGSKHIISYVGNKDNNPLHSIMWLFDGTDEFYRDYTIVYDPEEQK